MARVQGFADYRYAVITHPISSLNPAQVRERAEQALPQVARDPRSRCARSGAGI